MSCVCESCCIFVHLCVIAAIRVDIVHSAGFKALKHVHVLAYCAHFVC